MLSLRSQAAQSSKMHQLSCPFQMHKVLPDKYSKRLLRAGPVGVRLWVLGLLRSSGRSCPGVAFLGGILGGAAELPQPLCPQEDAATQLPAPPARCSHSACKEPCSFPVGPAGPRHTQPLSPPPAWLPHSPPLPVLGLMCPCPLRTHSCAPFLDGVKSPMSFLQIPVPKYGLWALSRY